MFVYFFLKVLVFIHEHNWAYLNTSWGYWYLVEIIGFVLIPLRLYTHAVKYKNVAVVKLASILTLIGILLNRLNTSVIAFNWQVAERYIPSWQEIWVTATVICVELIVLRWIINRMPILSNPPLWARGKEHNTIRKIFLLKENDKVREEKEIEEWKVSSM